MIDDNKIKVEPLMLSLSKGGAFFCVCQSLSAGRFILIPALVFHSMRVSMEQEEHFSNG
jgi:hypothetical protein